MEFKPHKYQQNAMDFLRSHDRAALFLDLGMGKTSITLTVLNQYLYEDFSIRKVLVIAPLFVALDSWSREADKWDHLHDLRISKMLGSSKEREDAYYRDADIYVINRENVIDLVEKHGTDWQFDAIIIDELSSFKSSSAKRWRMLKRITPMCRIVWGLTATPVPNGYMDLFAEMYLIDGGRHLGKTLSEYRMMYFTPGAHKGYIVYQWLLKRGAKERIDTQLKDICLSMSAADWLEMPECTHIDRVVQMNPKERKLYDRFQQDYVLPLVDGKLSDDIDSADGAIVGTTAATVSNKLLQMSNGAVYDNEGNVLHIHDAKLEALDEIIEAANGDPVLVFYQYKHDLERLKARFPQAETLDKGTESIAKWNRGEIPILLCHPASIAYGLNLQDGGHIIVWFGMNWSCELTQQSEGRLNRQGQTKPVLVYRLITENTVDQKVIDALDRKNTTQAALLDALKDYFGKET